MYLKTGKYVELGRTRYFLQDKVCIINFQYTQQEFGNIFNGFISHHVENKE